MRRLLSRLCWRQTAFVPVKSSSNPLEVGKLSLKCPSEALRSKGILTTPAATDRPNGVRVPDSKGRDVYVSYGVKGCTAHLCVDRSCRDRICRAANTDPDSVWSCGRSY